MLHNKLDLIKPYLSHTQINQNSGRASSGLGHPYQPNYVKPSCVFVGISKKNKDDCIKTNGIKIIADSPISTGRSRHHDTDIFSFALLQASPHGGQRLWRGDSKDRQIHGLPDAGSSDTSVRRGNIWVWARPPRHGVAGSSGPVASSRRSFPARRHLV
jgi:hypothetical protein